MRFSSINKVDYLCFEGGGGKGVVYLGAVQALEEMLPKEGGEKSRSIIRPHPAEGDPKDSGAYAYSPDIKGISGASAGAITAFMLALGMTSSELKSALEELYPVGKQNRTINIFNTFFDYPKDSMLHDGKEGVKFRTVFYKAENSLEPPFKSDKTQFTVGYQTFQAASISQWYVHLLYNMIVNPSFDIFKIGDRERDEIVSSTIYKRIFEYNEKNVKKGGLFKSPLDFIAPSRLVDSKNVEDAKIFLRNLYNGSGVFLGYKIREFFVKHLEAYLKRDFIQRRELSDNVAAKPPETLGFMDFYRLSGVDLRLTATNVVSQKPEIFSKDETPNFPIVEAVSISMNIPFVFKPILCIPGDGPMGRPSLYPDFRKNQKFTHAYVDGGMLNNYPLHAFDEILLDKGIQYTVFNDRVLGFNLANKMPTLAGLGLSKAIPALLNTFMYPSDGGQVKTAQERYQTIYLDPGMIDTLDFAPDSKLRDEQIAKAKKATQDYFK